MPENTGFHAIVLKYPFLMMLKLPSPLSFGARQDKDMSSVLFLLETGWFLNHSSDLLPVDPISSN